MRQLRFLSIGILFSGLAFLRADTVLVLPFVNESKQANIDWIGESIAEAVGEALASEGALVLERDDRLEVFRRLSLRSDAVLTHASVIRVGEALDASRVIYGQYELSAPSGANGSRGSLRIAARILDLKHMKQGHEYAEIGALEDLALLQSRLAWQTLQLVAPGAAPSKQEYLSTRPPVRLDAVENYIRGLLAANEEAQHRFFTRAARLDERYSQPCFQLGKLYWNKKDYRGAASWLARIGKSSPHYFEAQFYLGLCRYYTADFAGAEQSFVTVSQAVPLNEVFNDLGAAQMRRSPAAALDNFRKALEGDDADPDYHFNLGYGLWKSGRFEEAAQSFRSALERNPGDTEATTLLGRALKRDGPRRGDPRSDGRERLKTNYEETAYRQLKAELEGRK